MVSRTSRRWVNRLLLVSVIIVGCAGVAELALRMIVPTVVADSIRTQLPLAANQEIDVSLGGSALLSAVRGTVGDVTVTMPNMVLGEGITGDVVATAASVPFRSTNGEISDATVTLNIHPEQLGAVARLVTQGIAESAEVASHELFVTHTLSLFGMTLPLSVSLQLEAVDGQIAVTPTEVSAGTWDLTAEQISSATGSALDGLLGVHSVCIADRLPIGVTLSEIDMSDTTGVKVTAELAPTLLSDPSQQTYGRCDS